MDLLSAPFNMALGRHAFLLLLCFCYGLSASEDQTILRGPRGSPALWGESWLRQYGYLAPLDSTDSSNQDLSEAIREMQRVYTLEVTGLLDQQTITAMKRPRCGVPDKTNVRWSTYEAVGTTWDKYNLTYSIETFAPKIAWQDTSKAIRRAFKVWEDVSPFTFEEIPYVAICDRADIMISFHSGPHKGHAFKSSDLAHGGRRSSKPGRRDYVHFNSDWQWSIPNQHVQGFYNVFLVAVHELGHILGLGHSDDTSSIMHKDYKWMDTDDFQLPAVDRQGIQDLYGYTDVPNCDALTQEIIQLKNDKSNMNTQITQLKNEKSNLMQENTRLTAHIDNLMPCPPPGDETTCYNGDGSDYRGELAKSISGETCQNWTAQTPHKHNRTPEKYPNKGLESNYCRNPDGWTGPWCYTTDPDKRWELCNISKCDVAPDTDVPNCDALTQEIIQLKNDKSNMNTQITQLKNEKSNLMQENTRLTAHIDNLMPCPPPDTDVPNCDALTQEITQLMNTEITQLKNDKSNMNTEITQLKNEKSNMNIEITQLKNEKSNMNKEITQLKNEKSNLMEENTQLKAHIDNLTPTPPPVKSCPGGWTAFEDRCYYITTEEKNWQKARDYCQSQGADLVVINSPAEQAFIRGLDPARYNWSWIGLKWSGGRWTWVDGTPLTTMYWHSRYPQHVEAWNSAVYRHDTDEWSNHPWESPYLAICEK